MSVYPKERFISLLMRKEIPKNRKRAEAEKFVPFFLPFYPFFCTLYAERARKTKKILHFSAVFARFSAVYAEKRQKRSFYQKGLCGGCIFWTLQNFRQTFILTSPNGDLVVGLYWIEKK